MVYTDGIHLVADSLRELHKFAFTIGLKPQWFQNHKKHPHYDIWGLKLKLAIKKGCKRVTKKELLLKSSKLKS
jgi:hypothetical protein